MLFQETAVRRFRTFAALVVAVACVAAPGVGEAQTAPAAVRVAVICGNRCEGGAYDVFRRSFVELGWVEGRNLTLDIRGAEGFPDRLPGIVAELLAAKPDVIVAFAPQPARAAKAATSTIPIVFVAVADPLGLRLVVSLARPEGNVTGLATLAPGGFNAKMLALLKEAVPAASRIAVLWSSKNPLHVSMVSKELPPAAGSLGVRLQMLDVTEPAAIAPAIETAARDGAQALLVLGDPMFHRPFDRIPALALEARLPALYIDRDVVLHGGGLISYGPNWDVMFRQGAVYADRILRGAKPADLPVEQASTIELVINQKTANALNITIPWTMRSRADRIVE